MNAAIPVEGWRFQTASEMTEKQLTEASKNPHWRLRNLWYRNIILKEQCPLRPGKENPILDNLKAQLHEQLPKIGTTLLERAIRYVRCKCQVPIHAVSSMTNLIIKVSAKFSARLAVR